MHSMQAPHACIMPLRARATTACMHACGACECARRGAPTDRLSIPRCTCHRRTPGPPGSPGACSPAARTASEAETAWAASSSPAPPRPPSPLLEPPTAPATNPVSHGRKTFGKFPLESTTGTPAAPPGALHCSPQGLPLLPAKSCLLYCLGLPLTEPRGPRAIRADLRACGFQCQHSASFQISSISRSRETPEIFRYLSNGPRLETIPQPVRNRNLANDVFLALVKSRTTVGNTPRPVRNRNLVKRRVLAHAWTATLPRPCWRMPRRPPRASAVQAAQNFSAYLIAESETEDCILPKNGAPPPPAANLPAPSSPPAKQSAKRREGG